MAILFPLVLALAFVVVVLCLLFARNVWSIVGAFALVGAGLCALFAVALRGIDCHEESYSTCSTSGLVQLLMALGGIFPAVATLIAGIRGRGHPSVWLLITFAVYATWVAYIFLVPAD